MDEKEKEVLKKKVDESWKETVRKEKGFQGASGADDRSGASLPEVTFNLFISGLMMEALVALGEVENPVTKKKELNAPHARFVIDTLSILKEKTKNNLANDETEMLEAMLYELRTRYINKTKNAPV